MFSSNWSLRHVAVGLSLYLAARVSAVDQIYCSTFNTAMTNRNASIYQSNGLCSIFCRDKYAFAVLQYDGCWCSNYIPDDKTNTDPSSCSRDCPGFPSEDCGGIGLFGYLQLQLAPSGTRAAPISSTTSTTSTQQAITTVTESPDPVTTTISITTDSSETTTSSSSRTTRTTNTFTPTPIISLVTEAGSVQTITLLSTQTAVSQAASGRNDSSGLGAGAIAGLTVGLFALAAIIGIIIFLVLRRRKQKKDADAATAAALNEKASAGQEQAIPSRTMSENSRYVLGTDGRQVVEAWEPDNVAGSRKSRLVPVDPRLDPFSGVYQRGENKSRESVNTIRDDHDYSRRVHHGNGPLRAVNPDTTNLDD